MNDLNGLPPPNYTQVPNVLFDVLMRELGHAELRVLLVAVRKTFGYHKERDAISITQFMTYTGLSRQGVVNAVEQAIAHGYLRECGKGKRGVNIYELVVQSDQSDALTSQRSRLVPVNVVDQSDPSTSQRSRLTKERILKENIKDIPPNPQTGEQHTPEISKKTRTKQSNADRKQAERLATYAKYCEQTDALQDALGNKLFLFAELPQKEQDASLEAIQALVRLKVTTSDGVRAFIKYAKKEHAWAGRALTVYDLSRYMTTFATQYHQKVTPPESGAVSDVTPEILPILLQRQRERHHE
jgi:hypothetical protein